MINNKTIIYRLYNIDTQKSYIGQTRNIDNRMAYHSSDLIYNKHHRKELQQEYNCKVDAIKELHEDNEFFNYIDFKSFVFDKYYKFEILEEVDSIDKEIIENIEDNYIIKYRNKNLTYNQLTNTEIENKYHFKEKEKSKYNNGNGLIKHIPKTPVERKTRDEEIYDKFKRIFFDKAVSINYGNESLFVGFDATSYNGLYTILSYIFKNNTCIENTVFNDITINKLKQYSLFHVISNTSLKDALRELKKNYIVNIDSNINKLKSETIFSIDILDKENLIKNICNVLQRHSEIKYHHSNKLHIDELIKTIEYKI